MILLEKNNVFKSNLVHGSNLAKSAKTILKNLQSTVTLITQESNSFIYCPEDNLKR